MFTNPNRAAAILAGIKQILDKLIFPIKVQYMIIKTQNNAPLLFYAGNHFSPQIIRQPECLLVTGKTRCTVHAEDELAPQAFSIKGVEHHIQAVVEFLLIE